ncbi:MULTISPECIES: transcriptional regulator [Pseudomonas]|uniref:transcriptional regulator n=1 Tax=Pseudomonas TaxID=286 RepID=UPI0015965691|nr:MULTISPECIES: YdaS family helix-turn-helix protein [Pseudomonas]
MKMKLQPLLAWLKTADDNGVSETGTTRAYLRLIGYGQKTASAGMAVGIERATSGSVTRQMLRPDDWHRLWPELADRSATLQQNIPANSHQRNSTAVAVNPSSASQAAS